MADNGSVIVEFERQGGRIAVGAFGVKYWSHPGDLPLTDRLTFDGASGWKLEAGKGGVTISRGEQRLTITANGDDVTVAGQGADLTAKRITITTDPLRAAIADDRHAPGG
jgi:hypothetical protein